MMIWCMNEDRVYNEVLLPAFNKCLKEQFTKKKKWRFCHHQPPEITDFSSQQILSGASQNSMAAYS